MDTVNQQAQRIAEQAERNRRGHLEQLLLLPPTAEIQEKLANWKPLEPKVTFGRDIVEKINDNGKKQLENKLALAEERDQLQAARPPGCWCLGLGLKGWGREKTFCSCPDGLDAKEKDDRRQAQERRDECEAAWERAGIPSRFFSCRLDSWPGAKTKPKLVTLLNDFARFDEWPPHSIYLYGPYGTGKTGLAVGYAWEWLDGNGGGDVVFRSMPKLLGELRATYGKRDRERKTENEEGLLQKFIESDLLILDDLGAEQLNGSGWVEDRLYRIIGERHDEQRPTLFTSNLSMAQLAERVGERICWRIAEMCGKEGIIEVKGPNLRDK